MDFKTWLTSIKQKRSDLKMFVEKIEPMFTESGFNATEFEKKVGLGIQKIDIAIHELLKASSDAKNKQN